MPAAGETILLVEDDLDLRRLFRITLTLAGFEVHEASDGLTALNVIDADPPDLVVLDLGLPVLSGHAVREQIQAQAQTRHIPIVIVTATNEDLTNVPVACTLRKPVSPDELLRTVRRCLQNGS